MEIVPDVIHGEKLETLANAENYLYKKKERGNYRRDIEADRCARPWNPVKEEYIRNSRSFYLFVRARVCVVCRAPQTDPS